MHSGGAASAIKATQGQSHPPPLITDQKSITTDRFYSITQKLYDYLLQNRHYFFLFFIEFQLKYILNLPILVTMNIQLMYSKLLLKKIQLV